jgi:pimeloyl-ACP methyl ester carboxylesterase
MEKYKIDIGRDFSVLLVRVAVIASILGLGWVVPTRAQASPAPVDRDEATAIIANARKILSPDGIERSEAVKIGGIDQWVSVRSRDRRNPVLLYIHGGPGYPSIPMSWWSAQGWDEYFTVIQWDQRATGKTHLLTDARVIAPTLTNKRMVEDAEEMVEWARKTFGKNKIFVLGHSYGSYLGLELAEHHPEFIYAYIGVAQLTDLLESERRGWQFAMSAARAAGNTDAELALEKIAPYALPGHPPSISQLYVERKWMTFYGGAMAYRKDYDADQDLSKLSPDYSDQDLAHEWDGNAFSTPYLFPALLRRDHLAPGSIKVPIILFEGRHDKNVNADVAAEWFAKLRAPEKHLIWFDNSAHMVMTEEPGKSLVSLVRYALPIAVKAGDFAH